MTTLLSNFRPAMPQVIHDNASCIWSLHVPDLPASGSILCDPECRNESQDSPPS